MKIKTRMINHKRMIKIVFQKNLCSLRKKDGLIKLRLLLIIIHLLDQFLKNKISIICR